MQKNVILLDGSMGTRLQAAGLRPGETPEDWNIDFPDRVLAVHADYVAAGSSVVYSNTFGANALKYHGGYTAAEVTRAGVVNARRAGVKVALDIGPTGRLLKPAGDCDFEEAYAAFAEQVEVGAAAGADLIVVETMTDTLELKAAVLAAKEHADLPVYATVALQEDGKLLTGGSVETVAAILEGLGVDAYGFNCGLGPDLLLPFVKRLAAVSTRPIIVKANAGLPAIVNGETRFTIGPEAFASAMSECIAAGAAIVGGCCGTTPDHIRAVAALSVAPARLSPGDRGGTAALISSGSRFVDFAGTSGLVIGERINPTGKKRLREAYKAGDTAYILREAIAQVDAGASVLDVNAGVPGIDEAAVLTRTVESVQSVTDVPVQLDTSDPVALERALRRYNGKALVNSVNGKRESMDAVFPLVKKYGGMIVALCLDEHGIPDTVDGRLEIARRILAHAAEFGIPGEAFLFDALTLAVSSDPEAAKITLGTVGRLTEELGVKTVLGVSNVSFGLPNRPALNNAMFALAKRAGLTAAIANPSVIRDEIVAGAEDVLLGRDRACLNWIAANSATAADLPPAASASGVEASAASLISAVKHGLKDDAEQGARALLTAVTPLEVINTAIVPALEEVGAAFERGTLYLPQLLMAAEAAGAAFSAVKANMSSSSATPAGGGGSPIVIATVKGDIHDIGKNIVRALLENYGFDVVDLGRDVAPELIVKAAIDNHSRLVGLSALMTTTVKAMAETIRLLHEADPEIRTFVGGAVLTADYAAEIGATWYAKDAMASVRLAERFYAGK